MNLTPTNWKKSQVTEYKQYVEKGMRLYSTGCEWVTVMKVDGDNMQVHFTEENRTEWFNMNDLQLGWEFSKKSKQMIELVHKIEIKDTW